MKINFKGFCLRKKTKFLLIYLQSSSIIYLKNLFVKEIFNMKSKKLLLTALVALAVPFGTLSGGFVKAEGPSKASEDAASDAWEKQLMIIINRQLSQE